MQGKPSDITQDMAELNQQTAKAPWRELQVFFASGKTIFVDAQLDLIAVAVAIKNDDHIRVRQWQADRLVNQVSDEQALDWFQREVELWTVVVKPFVLVQDKP